MTAPLVSTSDRPYQLLPPLDSEQRHILKQSIEKCGVLEPVVFDEDGEILDGHHRVEIAEALGIEYPRRVISDLDRPGKFAYALTVNVARRHLTPSDRSGLVAQLRLRGMSIREIAKATGINRETVRRDLAGDTSVSPERVTGADGKSYAASRPAATTVSAETPEAPGPVDAAVETPSTGSGSTSAPAASPPSSGAGPAPAADEAADPPAPRQEPDLKAKIRADLAEIGAEGTTLAAIAFGFRRGEVADADLGSAMGELLTGGEVSIVGESQGRALFALSELITDETPEPADRPWCGAARELGGQQPCPIEQPCPDGTCVIGGRAHQHDGYCLNAGGECSPEAQTSPDAQPSSPPPSALAVTPEQRAANQREIDRKRLIADGQKAARNLVMSVQAEIGTVVSAIDLGEKHLINAEMIAKLRRAVDLLESRLEASK